MVGTTGIPLANKPAGNDLRIRIHGNPGPNIAPPLPLLIRCRIFLLRAHERPNLIALDALAGEVPKRLVLKFRARGSQINQEGIDRVAGHASHPAHGPHGISFHEGGDDLRAFIGTQLVHAFNLNYNA